MECPLDDFSLAEACTWLSRKDNKLHQVIRQYGLPPLWARPQSYASLIHIVLEQQVSLASALASFQKLTATLGQITPESLLSLNDRTLFQIGFSRQKTAYARGLAVAILEGNLNLTILSSMSADEARAYLKQFKGIGDWTADIFILMCLLHPDVMPKGDLALYEAFRRLYGLEQRPSHTYFQEHTLHWQPWRSVGARLLWHFYLCEKKISI